MTATPHSTQDVLAALEQSHSEWPHSEGCETVTENPEALGWEAAAFIEEWFSHEAHDDLEEAICALPLEPAKFGYTIAEWHAKKPPEAMLKAHLLRLVKGWEGETALHDHLAENPSLAEALGFDSDDIPSQPALWRVRTKRVAPEQFAVLRTIAAVVVQVAREHDVPAPAPAFRPDQDTDPAPDPAADSPSVTELTIEKTTDVWQHAKPFLEAGYELNRGSNTEVPESAWWEAHAFMGAREEMYANDGLRSFTADTARERVQSGSNHRHQLQKLSADESRRSHRRTTKALIKRARGAGELDRYVTCAIDITKSNPWRCKPTLDGWHKTPAKRNVTEPWILGYKDHEKKEGQSIDYYFQWASIQIVGFDIPVVLDAIPVKRGMARHAIVDELLSHATDMVDIELVLMDREFDAAAVKNVCECAGVYYLNPARMFASERGTCTDLRRQGKAVHIEEQDSPVDDATTRKRIYLPARNDDLWKNQREAGDETDDDGDTAAPDAPRGRPSLLTDFAETTGTDPEELVEDGYDTFGALLDEIRYEEAQQPTRGSDEDKQLYALFETNHPFVSKTDDIGAPYGEIEQLHMVERFVKTYSYRWGIENGYKQIKTFRVRTTSKDHEYRFFNFLFACTLYNVWRLVDLLVKLSLEADPDYEPLVTADLFLTIAKQFFGLDPPD